ncbi:MAG: hypothetical protein ACKO1W_15620 [Microcystaceae cyanobacterium]
MSLSPELLAHAADYLERHEEVQRIRKLLFCLAKKYWENDPNILNSLPIEQLLQELTDSKPTIEQLTFSLYKLVKTLNRPKVYTGVGKAILDQLGPIYSAQQNEILEQETLVEAEVVEVETLFNAEPPDSPLEEATPEVVTDPRVIADQIAQTLNQHPEQVRIKKLMFAVGKGYWENSVEVIDRYGFSQLILELRQGFPTQGELQAGFSNIVSNINKATLYLAIANLILKQMANLYEDLSEPLEDTLEANTATQIVQIPMNATALRSAPSHTATAIVEFGQQNNNEPLVTVLGSVPTPSAPANNSPPAKKYQAFEVRSEIMQYANPLRAKILLFSLLFNNWEKNQDWSMLRSYSLDDLVEQVLLSRRPANDVEMRLLGLAQSMQERDVYQQTAKTLIKVLKPIL